MTTSHTHTSNLYGNTARAFTSLVAITPFVADNAYTATLGLCLLASKHYLITDWNAFYAKIANYEGPKLPFGAKLANVRRLKLGEHGKNLVRQTTYGALEGIAVGVISHHAVQQISDLIK